MKKPRMFSITRALERLEKRGIKVINALDTPEGAGILQNVAASIAEEIDKRTLDAALATLTETSS